MMGAIATMLEPAALKRPPSRHLSLPPERGTPHAPRLAYHVEEDVASWTSQEDAALMADCEQGARRPPPEAARGTGAAAWDDKGSLRPARPRQSTTHDQIEK